MQNSGYLDLKSLMALSRTAKAHAFDELSLIQLIDHEITRYHGVRTMQEAIDYWREVCRCRCWQSTSTLKRWLERDGCCFNRVSVTRDMLSDASGYEVMLRKMLQSVPTEAERLKIMNQRASASKTLLLDVADSPSYNLESIKTVLAFFPESEHLQALGMQDFRGWTLLHYAANSTRLEFLEFVLTLYPDQTERLKAMRMRDTLGRTLLHQTVHSDKSDCFECILTQYPESERLRAVSMVDRIGCNVLSCAARFGNMRSIELIIGLYPEAERLRAVTVINPSGTTVLHSIAESHDFECLETVLALLPESERWQALSRTNGSGNTVLHLIAILTSIDNIKTVLSLYPTESQLLQALEIRNQEGQTVLDRMDRKTRSSIMQWLSKSESLALHLSQ